MIRKVRARRHLVTAGRKMGLTRQQASEVIQAWRSWYAATGRPWSDSRIMFALRCRVAGQTWRPPNADAARALQRKIDDAGRQ